MTQNKNSVPMFQNAFIKSSRDIYTASSFARSSLLYLQEIGTLSALQPHGSARENLGSYLFFLVTEGAGMLEYQGKSYQLRAGDCAFIDCRKGYRMCSSEHQDALGNYDELWSLSWIHFNGNFMQTIYDKYTERGGQPVFHCMADEGRVDHAGEYQSLHQSLFDIVSSESYVKDMEIAEKLAILLRMLMVDAWDEQGTGTAGAKRMSVMEIKQYIETHFSEKLTLDSLAKQYYISKEYLTRIFREQYGFTVNQYVMHVRISKAKSLLRFSEDSIEEIGVQVGIPDANYFSRAFRRVEGISPSEYRKRW